MEESGISQPWVWGRWPGSGAAERALGSGPALPAVPRLRLLSVSVFSFEDTELEYVIGESLLL